MPTTITVPHEDVLLGASQDIKLVARLNGVIRPDAIFSNVNYILNNPIGTITPNPTNPALAVFKGGSLGDAILRVDATITLP